MNQEHDLESPTDVAIIGMAGRFPGANTIDELWQLACAGREAITFFRPDELDSDVPPDVASHPRYVRARGVMEHADCFDAAFFGIAPMEAQVIDPQARILLELSWEAMENAGYNPLDQKDPVGVFVGSGFNNYLIDHVLSRPDIVASYGRHLVELANAPDYLASRISYKLNLKGPSISLYTGCSSSLVAICYAVESLLNHQSDMALAGGAFVAMPPKSGYVYHDGEMASPDGHTRPFDAAAAGTVFSSGGGMVLLKRLGDALADGDEIYAVIRGTGLNNDGADKVSFTAPSVAGQAGAIAAAHAAAGIEPDDVSYVEAHGTGTPLGDPIEVQALSKAFQGARRRQYCAIGSIKANIGHLDAAAGVAGLIKVAFALRHKALPPSINYETPNPAIAFEKTPFYVNTKLTPWVTDTGNRIAGVSSFGVGGTNAHVILAEGPARQEAAASTIQWTALPLSARTPEALERLTARLASHLRIQKSASIAAVAKTLWTGREHFRHRRIVICNSPTDAADALESRAPLRVITSATHPSRQRTVFMFSGQGAQYPDMGRGLYESQPTFRATVDAAAEQLEPLLGLDLRNVLLLRGGNGDASAELLNETWLTQPALFTVEYALAKVLNERGITPDVCVGHSIGEYVAACIAGVFSFEDALRLVALRGKLMFSCERGAMLAVMLPAADVERWLTDGVSVAAINAPSTCVVSGPTTAVVALEQRLSAAGISSRPLHTSHAFHSAMMDPITSAFAQAVEQTIRQRPSKRFLSNVTGTWILPEQATDPQYWADHLRNPVKFSQCIRVVMSESGSSTFIEVGPGSALRSLVGMHAAKPGEHLVLSAMRGANDAVDDEAFFLRTLGALWTDGQVVQWPHDDGPQRKVLLPPYPFERTRHWISRQQRRPDTQQESAAQTPATASVTAARADSGSHSGSSPVASGSLMLVLETWTQALGYGSIDEHADFFEIGGNSLIASNIVARLRKALQIDISPIEIYQRRTALSFAAMLDEQRSAATRIQAMSTEKAKQLIG